jgi:branched-chain amino acid transport system ATP-binding protein
MLEVDGLNAFYGKSHVLHGVSFTVGAGKIVALLGRNGSGRSTTARAIMGLVRAEGTVRWKGASILGRPTHEIARRGLGYVPESRDVFPGLTVQQNLLLGQKGARPGRWTFEAMYDMFPVLGERRHASAGVLSGGEQQMLALCRTLMGDPGLMIVDEPTEGLAPAIVELVADCLRRLRDGGVPVLLIEQKLAIALRISDRALVMGHGGIVFDGTPGQLLADAATRREWLEV